MKKIFNLGFILLSVALISFQKTKETKPKYNVLFIAVDDLKPLLGCYGEKQMKTPNIDRLAKMGTVFMNNYCQQAVCGPTRASLMTGMRPDYTRVWDLKTQMREMNPDILTIPQYFKQNGYLTTGIGKIYHPTDIDKNFDTPSWSESYYKVKPEDYNAETGMPINGRYQSVDNRKMVEQFEAATGGKKKKGEPEDEDSEKTESRGPAFESADVPDDAYLDGVVAKKAVAKLGELAKSKEPFFYAVGFAKPHLPFCSPKKYWDVYDRSKIQLAAFQELAKGTPEFTYQASGELVNNYVLPNGERYKKGYVKQTEANQRELIHGYYAAISYTDAQVGKLLDELDKQGLTKNTIIVLWGDHGWHLGDHTVWAKHTNLQQTTKAPLIFVSPTIKGNQKAQGITEFVDIFPTLTELAGLKTPEKLAGKSLVTLMKDSKKEVKNYAVSQYHRKVNKADVMGYTLRTKRYRYTAWYQENYRQINLMPNAKIVGVELYDYEKDPNETENLAEKADYQKILKEHEKLMTEFLTNQSHSR